MDEPRGRDQVRIGFIGAGTLGNGLALALAARGYRVVAVSSRSPSSAEDLAGRIPGCEALARPQELADICDLAFITTPDDVISQVAAQVQWHHGQGVVHCSGAEPLDILEPAARLGAITGSFHPFQTFACLEAHEETVERLEGTTFSVEGQGWLLAFLEGVAHRLGGKAILVRPEDRAIYHASAVMSCGYLVALLKAAADIWQAMGVPQDEALPVILHLASSTLTNLSRAGIDATVTGPLVRGDTTTVQRHLEALESRLPRLISLYCSLSLESLPLAQERVSREKLEAMEKLIKDYTSRYISQTHANILATD